MGFAQIQSRAQVGLTAPPVRVEVHLGSGLPTFTIVGLPAPVVRESKERVRAALAHCGFEFPAGRITVNLAPADLPKEGGRFDLPIALGILVASGQVASPDGLERCEFYGELALTGELKPVPGLLLAALHAAEGGRELYVPAMQAAELRLVERARVHPLWHLRDFGGDDAQRAACDRRCDLPAGVVPAGQAPPPDLADVRGQWQARRALVIAAVGQHSLLMSGPPGSGKSMLARRLPGLLPPLTRAETLEVAAIAAVAQLPLAATPARPFRSPASHRLGACDRRRRLDRAPGRGQSRASRRAVPRRVAGVRPARARGAARAAGVRRRQRRPGAAARGVSGGLPVRRGDESLSLRSRGPPAPPCRCRPEQLARYRARISGPLLDRIDLQLQLPPVDAQALLEPEAALADGRLLTSAQAAQQVLVARERSLARQGCLNAQLGPEDTLRHCRVGREGLQLLRRAAQSRGCSARSQHRLLRVARSIADLEGDEMVGAAAIAEALAMQWAD